MKNYILILLLLFFMSFHLYAQSNSAGSKAGMNSPGEQNYSEENKSGEIKMDNVKIYRALAKLKNINIFYRDTKTDGPVILCLHGRWGRGETWVDFMKHYGGKYRIIAPDQRGHGLSDKPLSNYTAEEMAADMISLLDYLNIDKVILVGHSMGGFIAGYLTATYPRYVKALAILDKSAKGPERKQFVSSGQLKSEDDPVTKDWPLPFRSLSEAQNFIRLNQNSELSYQYFMNSLVETVNGYEMMFDRQAMAANIQNYHNWFSLLPQIKCPVILVKSKGNEVVTDEDFAKMKSLLSDCSAYEMSNPDHNVYMSNKEEFYKYFDGFLNKVHL